MDGSRCSLLGSRKSLLGSTGGCLWLGIVDPSCGDRYRCCHTQAIRSSVGRMASDGFDRWTGYAAYPGDPYAWQSVIRMPWQLLIFVLIDRMCTGFGYGWAVFLVLEGTCRIVDFVDRFIGRMTMASQHD